MYIPNNKLLIFVFHNFKNKKPNKINLFYNIERMQKLTWVKLYSILQTLNKRKQLRRNLIIFVFPLIHAKK